MIELSVLSSSSQLLPDRQIHNNFDLLASFELVR